MLSVLNKVTVVKPLKCEAIKGCCQDGRSPQTAVLQPEIPLMSLMIHWYSSTFRTWHPSRGLQKKSHLKESISFIAVAQWKWKCPRLKYCVTLGPLVQRPNQTQLAVKCGSKTLVDVSHYLRYDFCLRTAKCVPTWDKFSDGIPLDWELWWRCSLWTVWGQ